MNFNKNVGWATLWAIFQQTHLVTLRRESNTQRIQLFLSSALPQSRALKSWSWKNVSAPAQICICRDGSIFHIPSRVARLFLVRDTKTEKMYQMNTKCTKWS
jgi:hypothetical protein